MTINCKGELLDLTQPKVMGILNVTPDSFYDGGRYANINAVLVKVETMLKEGAAIIDVGGYSSRPGANDVAESEESARILPVLEAIIPRFPEIPISVDTFRSKVAHRSLEIGAAIINDITAGLGDHKMMETVAHWHAPYIMMHMRGTPGNMQQKTDYTDLIREIIHYFSERIAAAKSAGIMDICIDPGFGFSKTLEQNYKLLNQLELLDILEFPLLVGISRKSMIYKLLGTAPQDALNGTAALHMVSLQKGAKILRAHDVKEAVECIKIFEQLNA